MYRQYYISGDSIQLEMSLFLNSGQLLNSGNREITYTAFQKTASITDLTHNLKLDIDYGINNQRIRSRFYNNNQLQRTNYYAANYEKIVEGNNTREINYISTPYGTIAVYVKENSNAGQMFYLYKDHLGSITKITNSSGSTVFSASYDAWGKRTVTNNTFKFHRGYTGHEHLTDFQLINMNGRMYDPLIGRFLSADPYVPNMEYSQDYNRYSYARNNPLLYTDPDGESIVIIAAIVIGAYIGGSTVNNSFNPTKWDYNNWQTYAGIAVGGLAGWAGAGIGASVAVSAAAGGASTIGAGVAGGMVGGMVSGGINGAGMTAIMGGNFNDIMGNITTGMVMGGFGGALSGGIGAAIGDFSGVAGGAFKNAMYELGHSAIKGAATGLAGGAMMAAMTQDANYLWKGAAIGAAFSVGMAGLRIGTLGTTFIPDSKYGTLEEFGQVYRRGSIFMPRGSGITLGRNVSVRLTGNLDYDRYLLQHETGHLSQINDMGAAKFYGRTAKEYIINPGFNAAYTTPGTLEYAAQYYSYQQLGYYYRWNQLRYSFP